MKTVIVAGALPPPYMGPTLATEVILNSSLSTHYKLIHVDTSLNSDFDTLGKFTFRGLLGVLQSYYSLAKAIIKSRPDLLYVQTTQSTLAYLKDSIYILIAKSFGVKVVGHLRGSEFKSWYQSLNGLLKRYVRFCHSKVDAQLVLGECLRFVFEDVIERERILVVPNGKDIDFSFADEQQRRPRKITILYLANFKKRKGVLETLEAAKFLNEELGIDFSLKMAGAPRDEGVQDAVKKFLASNPMLDVEIVGPVKGVHKYRLLAESDIFVFPPSEPEGHPWVIVEALAAGLPIIATDQGAIVESVLDHENGYITTGDPEDIARRLYDLINDSSKRLSMGERSRDLYKEHFTEGAMVRKLVSAFDWVLKCR